MRKRICVLLAVLVLTAALWGCEMNKGNAGSTRTQVQQFTQNDLTGNWTLEFTYTAFFKNMAAMEGVEDWMALMPKVSTKARFDMRFAFRGDGTCVSVAAAEDVSLATDQFLADLQSYLYGNGVYDYLYMKNSWGKAVVDKKLQEQGKTREGYADELMAEFMPKVESLFEGMSQESTVDYTLESNILTLRAGETVVSLMRCRYDGKGTVVFKQDSPEDICFYAGMDMTKEN